MVNDQTFHTPNKHVTHYTMVNEQTFCNITLSKHVTHYGIWSTARLSEPLTNTLPTMVNDQTFRTPNKHVTHYTMLNDQTFCNITHSKHVTHYGQRPDFPYP